MLTEDDHLVLVIIQSEYLITMIIYILSDRLANETLPIHLILKQIYCLQGMYAFHNAGYQILYSLKTGHWPHIASSILNKISPRSICHVEQLYGNLCWMV